MKKKRKYSEHDEALLEKILHIDREYGWIEWPTIMSLAQELEDAEEKEFWRKKCTHYNHLEEASVGML